MGRGDTQAGEASGSRRQLATAVPGNPSPLHRLPLLPRSPQPRSLPGFLSCLPTRPPSLPLSVAPCLFTLEETISNSSIFAVPQSLPCLICPRYLVVSYPLSSSPSLVSSVPLLPSPSTVSTSHSAWTFFSSSSPAPATPEPSQFPSLTFLLCSASYSCPSFVRAPHPSPFFQGPAPLTVCLFTFLLLSHASPAFHLSAHHSSQLSLQPTFPVPSPDSPTLLPVIL